MVVKKRQKEDKISQFYKTEGRKHLILRDENALLTPAERLFIHLVQ